MKSSLLWIPDLLMLAAISFSLASTVSSDSAGSISKWKNVAPPDSILSSGDVIFRHGNGFISNAFKKFSKRDQQYSHAGIISIENHQIYVYHAIGGEEKSSNKLRRSTLSEFCDPQQAGSFGIYSYAMSTPEKNSVAAEAKKYYRSGLEFDLLFDLKSDDKMYCSEFVYKIISKVKSDRNYLSLSEINGMKYVAIDDLYLNPHCHKIFSASYQN